MILGKRLNPYKTWCLYCQSAKKYTYFMLFLCKFNEVSEDLNTIQTQKIMTMARIWLVLAFSSHVIWRHLARSHLSGTTTVAKHENGCFSQAQKMFQLAQLPSISCIFYNAFVIGLMKRDIITFTKVWMAKILGKLGLLSNYKGLLYFLRAAWGYLIWWKIWTLYTFLEPNTFLNIRWI